LGGVSKINYTTSMSSFTPASIRQGLELLKQAKMPLQFAGFLCYSSGAVGQTTLAGWVFASPEMLISI
jgi:hypothetical protein